MNILFIKHFFEGFMVSEIPRVSVFGHCPYSVSFSYIYITNGIFFIHIGANSFSVLQV